MTTAAVATAVVVAAVVGSRGSVGNQLGLGGSAASVAAAAQGEAHWQHGGGSGSNGSLAEARRWQFGSGGGSLVKAAWWRWATAAALPPRTAAVATKTQAATAKVGAQTTLNNQLNAAARMGMETGTMTALAMAMKPKVTAATAAAWRQCGRGGGGSAAAAMRQHGGSSSSAVVVVTAAWQGQQHQW